MDETVFLTLPEMPPPLSACFNNNRRRGRVKTKRYSEWIRNVMAASRRYEPLDCEVAAIYLYRRPDRRRRDLGNLEKATSDILVALGVLVDDSQIVDLRLAWSDRIEKPVQIIVSRTS